MSIVLIHFFRFYILKIDNSRITEYGVMRGICFTDEKPEVVDLRSNPPTKVKMPSFNKPSPPPVKDKPNKVLPK